MEMKVIFYIISAGLALVGFPLVLILIYLDLINADITSRFFWVAAVVCCVLSIVCFSLGRILAIWKEEDEEEE